MERIKNYISGELINPQKDVYLPNYSPATGEIYSYVPDSDVEDMNSAINSAKRAYTNWANTPVKERAFLLRKISEALLNQRENFAMAESIDTGKPLKTALEIDIARSIQNFEFFADAITQLSTNCYPTDQLALNYTLQSPIGVVGCISPWNLPLYLLTWKIAPALAAGNTVVAKPSEIAPMTAFLLSEICIKVGLPPGVLNVVHGTGQKIGAALSSHPDVKAISFTGSTKTGSEIARTAAPLFKKLSLEMGGKNPTIVFSDANFDQAVSGCMKAAFSNQGQICLCGSRIYVERSIFSKFKDALVTATKSLKVGDPSDPNTDQGAVISATHLEKIFSHIEKSKHDGGTILSGGNKVVLHGRCKNGWFIEPTLIENLDIECEANQQEIFGPVATITAFDSEEEVIYLANRTLYGLSASIWTNEISRAHRMATSIQAGIVWINCWMLRDLRTPFGGIKSSGLGREGGKYALDFFTEQKNICIKL